MVCVAVLLLGSVSFGSLSVDLLPDIGTPRITLLTVADTSALAPQEVERLVTALLENQVQTVSGVRRVTSTSREGMSVITVEFPWGTNLDIATLHIREAVDKVRQDLPDDVERPAVLRWDPGSEPVMGLAVAGSGGLGALREMVEAIIVPRMEQVQGIAGAQVTGGAQREIQVNLDPEKLALFGFTVADVETALERSNVSLQSGNVLQGALRYQVRALGEFANVTEIADVVVGSNPRARQVRLGDIGLVSEGTKPRAAGALLDGRQAIGVLLYREAGSNTIEAVAAAEAALDELRAQYPELTLEIAFENASFISEAIQSVVQNIALGSLFAFGILFLFLRDPRNPVLIGIAIPISIVATFVLCYFADISLNIMTLGGLALGAGLLVDNSIVVLENIFRHRQQGASPTTAARRGTEEVAMAVAAATVTTIAVFLPIAYVHGVAGELFAAQAWTVTFALLASLAVSLTVLPMLAARFLHLGMTVDAIEEGAATGADPVDQAGRLRRLGRWARGLPGRGFDWLLTLLLFWIRLAMRSVQWVVAPLLDAFSALYDGFAWVYHRTLLFCLGHRAMTLGGLTLLLVVGVSIGQQLPWELMPQVNTGRFEVTIDVAPGTPFERLEQIVQQTEAAARDGDGVARTFATLGADPGAITSSAAGALDLAPTRARLAVIMEGTRTRTMVPALTAAMARVRTAAAGISGVTVVIDAQSNPMQRSLGLGDAGFRVLVRGDDLNLLQDLADRGAEHLAAVAGLEDINSRTTRGNPEIRLRVRREVAALYGVSVEDVTRALQAGLQGTVPTQFVEFDRRIDIRVVALGEQQTVEALLNQPYETQLGPVPFRELVEYERAVGPQEIQRRDRVREVPITATLAGISLSEAVAGAEGAMAEIDWPPGYRWRIGGEREEVQASFQSLAWALALAAALVYMVMAAQFESLVHPFVILCTLPLGWVGVVTGLWLVGLTINVVALIGAVVLTGIVVNDGIVKIDTINRLRAQGMARRQAVIEGSALRLRPILMTTVTTICALIPLALGLGAGAELQRPLAVAVIGGEFTGTLLTLIVLPVIYEILDPRRKPAG
jgi:HAE1 family hydrophobic/amphiphilic exporter-1